MMESDDQVPVQEFTKLIHTLDSDARQALDLSNENDTPFNRRLVARNNWALIEGLNHGFQAFIYDRFEDLLTEEERFHLEDETIEFEPQRKPKRKNLKESIKFTLDIFRRINNLPTVDYSVDGWYRLCESIKTRGNVIHPKKVKDLEISDEQFNNLQKGMSWLYLEIVKSIFLYDFKHKQNDGSRKLDLLDFLRDNYKIFIVVNPKYTDDFLPYVGQKFLNQIQGK